MRVKATDIAAKKLEHECALDNAKRWHCEETHQCIAIAAIRREFASRWSSEHGAIARFLGGNL